jgi:hypothetical protein
LKFCHERAVKMQQHFSTAFLILLACASARAGLVEFPENDALVEDIESTVVLRCVADSPLPAVRIIWTEFATTPSGQSISDNRGIVPSHPNAARYAIIGDPGNDEFFLQITNVTYGDGGTYLCQDLQASPPTPYRGFAELVVLETEPRCSDYATGTGVVIDGQMYSAECEVRYKGNLAPHFEWFGPTGHFIQNGTRPPNSVWSWMAFTATREIDAQVFFHQANFTAFFALPDYASNIPEYTHLHFGPRLDVSWPPDVITVTPIKPTYVLGDELICNADSKPPAQYQWQNMRTLQFPPPGPSFFVTADLVGFDQSMRCNAAVLIEGAFYTNDIFVNVSVPTPTTMPPPTTPQPTTPPPADGPCRDLSGRWTATNPSADFCIDMDTKGNIFLIIRNATDLFFVVGRGKTQYGDYKHIGFTAHWPNTGVGGFAGECHSCYGTEVILMAGLYRNKHAHDICGESYGTGLTPLFVFVRSGPICLGMEVDEIRTNEPWIVEKMGVKAKKITPMV